MTIGRRMAITAAAVLIVLGVFSAFIGKSVMAMASTTPTVRLPILMYHSIIKNSARQGDYVVSPEVLESDLKYLSDNGYTAISAAQLIAYVYEGEPLPEKPVMITFDDGFLNNLVYAVPLLEKYNMCAIISVVGSFTDFYETVSDHNPAYAYLTYNDICEAEASGYIEIGNHTYDMHRKGERQGSTRRRGESVEDYQSVLLEDLTKVQTLIRDNCGFEPIVFTYPFGRVDKASHDVIKSMGFKMSLGCGEVVNKITTDPQCLYNLGRFNRPAGLSTEEFMKRIK